jgi:hypothetical protein
MSLVMTTTAATSTVSMTAVVSAGVGGALIAILLVMLLTSREIISASSYRSKKILSLADAAIIPLLLIFVATVAFQVMEIVHPMN